MDNVHTVLTQTLPGQASRPCLGGAVQDCIEKTNARKFWLVEVPSCCKPDKTCTAIRTSEPLDYAVFVENFNVEEVLHLAVDACLICDDQTKRCDAALISDRGWHFIEFKLNIKMMNASDNIKAARKQIESTVLHFLSHPTLIPEIKRSFVNAGIVLSTYPRNSTLTQNAQASYDLFLVQQALDGELHFSRTIQI